MAESGRSASHRAHFSWHAALHELALGDTEAVRRRYYSQLAPPAVGGVRALIDSGSLLWRWRVTTTDWFPSESAPPPVEPVVGAVGDVFLDDPASPFVALHGALLHAASGDLGRLGRLAARCRATAEAPTREVVAPLCDALVAAGEERWPDAADGLEAALPRLVTVGGSAAQREIVEETLVLALARSGRTARAAAVLEARLDRRPSPLDARRRVALEELTQVIPSGRLPTVR